MIPSDNKKILALHSYIKVPMVLVLISLSEERCSLLLKLQVEGEAPKGGGILYKPGLGYDLGQLAAWCDEQVAWPSAAE